MNDEFLARVSFAGVPHIIAHSNDVTQATIFPLSPKELCKIYWMLSALNISYSYSINGITVTRNFSVTSPVAPKNRLIAPATFYHTGYDGQTQTSYVAELFLTTVYFNSQDLSQVGLAINFGESDSFNLINLGLRPIINMTHVSINYTLFEKNFIVYLNYNPSLVTSAAITHFSITPEFHTLLQ